MAGAWVVSTPLVRLSSTSTMCVFSYHRRHQARALAPEALPWAGVVLKEPRECREVSSSWVGRLHVRHLCLHPCNLRIPAHHSQPQPQPQK